MIKVNKPQNSKTRILSIAAGVFYNKGYRATGVAAVAKAAHIKKSTLYHHFSSKDKLIEEALTLSSEHIRAGYVKAWNKKGLKPIDKLTVLFDEMDLFFKQPGCKGCPFINAAGEYTSRKSIPHRICEAHYGFVAENLEKFAKEADLKKPRLLAKRIVTVIAGGYTSWLVTAMEDAALQAKHIAELIIKEHQK